MKYEIGDLVSKPVTGICKIEDILYLTPQDEKNNKLYYLMKPIEDEKDKIYENGEVNFTLKDAASYRTKGASKATPGFDVMDYGQETYEFGSSTQDARHFDKYVLKVLQEDAEILSELFNSEEK